MSTHLLWALWGSGVLPMSLAVLVARMLPHWHRRREPRLEEPE